jgi:AcrR family transcriptional regulator
MGGSVTTTKTDLMPRTARGEATRRRLLEAAEALFGRRGFHATSVADITRAAKVGQGTFYLYFHSKEEILKELVHHLSRELRSAIRAEIDGLEDRAQIEEVGMRTFFQFVATHRDLYRIVFESEFIDPSIFRWYYERLADGYVRGLERAMERGDIPRQDPETLAWCLMGPVHLLGMRWVLWEGREPPAEAIEQTMRAVRAMLTCQQP